MNVLYYPFYYIDCQMNELSIHSMILVIHYYRLNQLHLNLDLNLYDQMLLLLDKSPYPLVILPFQRSMVEMIHQKPMSFPLNLVMEKMDVYVYRKDNYKNPIHYSNYDVRMDHEDVYKPYQFDLNMMLFDGKLQVENLPLPM